MEESLDSEGSIKNYRPRFIAGGLGFIGLNVADAWLTQHLLLWRGEELFWWSVPFNSNLLIKGLAASAIVLVLLLIGKGKLLKWLNIGMGVIVLVNVVSVLVYLYGYFIG